MVTIAPEHGTANQLFLKKIEEGVGGVVMSTNKLPKSDPTFFIRGNFLKGLISFSFSFFIHIHLYSYSLAGNIVVFYNI